MSKKVFHFTFSQLSHNLHNGRVLYICTQKEYGISFQAFIKIVFTPHGLIKEPQICSAGFYPYLAENPP